MRNFVIINGVNSNTINGLGINELPPITKPEMRNIREEIDGRDGDIITELGYSAYDKTITIGLFGTGYDINDIVAFFKGEGTIVFSNEPDKYYNFKILNQIDYESLQKFRTASITFHCQPFKYPLNETPLEIEYDYIEDEGETLTLNNTGNATMELNLKGNTSQASTPTPTSPVNVSVVSGDNEVIVCGKNLFVKSSAIDGEKYSNDGTISIDSSYCRSPLYMNVNGVTKLTISGSDSSSNGKIIIYDENKNEIDYWSTRNRTIDMPNNSYYIRISIEKIYKNTLQVEAGETATSYSDEATLYPIDLPVENLVSEYHRVGNQMYLNNATGNTDYIFKAGTYTITYKNNSNSTAYIFMRKSSSSENENVGSGSPVTFTSNEDFNVWIYISGMQDGDISEIQLEEGTKANSYSPFGQTPIKMRGIGTYEDYFVRNSGKNLFSSVWEQGVIDGTSGINVDSSTVIRTKDYISVVPNKHYAINRNISTGQINVRCYGANKNYLGTGTDYLTLISGSNAGNPMTANVNQCIIQPKQDVYYLRFNDTSNNLSTLYMMAEGDTQEIYEPCGTGKWCKYNAIGSIVLDGSEGTTPWSTAGVSTDGNYYRFTNTQFATLSIPNVRYYSDKFKTLGNVSSLDVSEEGTANTSSAARFYLWISKTRVNGTSSSDIVSWLTNNNVIVDYINAQPYLSLIESETLISQLDAIQNAVSYTGQTNITQVNNDKAFIISAKALEDGTNEVVVNNIGNVYSKPLLALEGSGNVDIYLDDTQILKANVESKMNIDINTLEAYNPDTSALLNRQVIGNYNSMTFQPGNNKLTINGSLSKATITNYIRWL